MPVVVKWGKDTPITTVEWLWKPFIPFGKVSLIQGDGGEGKTTLMLKIAAMLSKGELPPTNYQGKLSDGGRMEPITTFYASTEEEISDSALLRFKRNGGDVNRFAYSAESLEHMNLNYKHYDCSQQEDELMSHIPETAPENTPSKFTDACNILIERLSSGPVEYTAVMAVLNENAVSKRTAERAKKDLGICSIRRDGKTYWALPEE